MPFLPFSVDAKAWEPIAIELRGKLANPHRNAVVFDPWLLAPLLGLEVIECKHQGLTVEEAAYMAGLNGDHWSGGVLPTLLPNGKRVCILNPMQPLGRRKVTLMEEISHCHLKHTATRLIETGGQYVRDFEKGQEREAFGVAAATLLPWNLFYPLVNAGSTCDEIADQFQVTKQLAEYRIKISGASALHRSRLAKRV